jgi:hypothetical protein
VTLCSHVIAVSAHDLYFAAGEVWATALLSCRVCVGTSHKAMISLAPRAKSAELAKRPSTA